MHKFIHQIEEKRQAIFVGFFGPIGVSAIFYLYITLEFLEGITVDGVQRADAARLGDVTMVVVWFLAICSIVSHLTFNLSPLKLTYSGRPWAVNPSRKARILSPKNPIQSIQFTSQR